MRGVGCSGCAMMTMMMRGFRSKQERNVRACAHSTGGWVFVSADDGRCWDDGGAERETEREASGKKPIVRDVTRCERVWCKRVLGLRMRWLLLGALAACCLCCSHSDTRSHYAGTRTKTVPPHSHSAHTHTKHIVYARTIHTGPEIETRERASSKIVGNLARMHIFNISHVTSMSRVHAQHHTDSTKQIMMGQKAQPDQQRTRVFDIALGR